MAVRPEEHRTLIMEAMRAVMEGRMPVAAANSFAMLSGEMHKSIQQEWNMRTHVFETDRTIEHRPLVMLEARRADAETT